MHDKWSQFLQNFPFKLKHKSKVQNKVVYALSKRADLLITMRTKVVGFEQLKELYEIDKDFQVQWGKYKGNKLADDFHIHKRVPDERKSALYTSFSLREKLIRDLHGGGLVMIKPLLQLVTVFVGHITKGCN